MPLWCKKLIKELPIWAIYTLVAACFTYPLVLHLLERLPGSGADPIQYYWFAWWDGWSLLSHNMSPFYCPLVFFPDGAYLNAEPLPFGLAFGLLSKLLAPVLSFNLLYLFLYVFSAWGCYRLALYLWNRRDVAFLAGLIFGFSPFMTMHGIGHFNMLNGGFVALMILGCLKALDNDRFSIGKVLSAGVLLGLVGLSSNYYLIYLSIWLVGLSVFLAIKGRLFPLIWRLAAIVGVAVLIMLPQIFASVEAIKAGLYRGVSTLGSAFMSSIDLFGVLIPSRMHPLWGRWTVETFQFMGAGSIEKIAYLGIVVVILAILGWWHYRNRMWAVWVAISTIGAWLFSLGPVLQVFGQNTFLPLPGMAIALSPILKNARNSCRWTMLVTLGVALLAAGGMKWLLEQGVGGRRIRWVWIPVTLLILFEFLPMPYPTVSANVPIQTCQLPEDPDHPAVLNLPLGRSDGLGGVGEFDATALLLQTVHHKPIVGGYLTRMRRQDKTRLQNGVLADIVHVQSMATDSIQANFRAENMRDTIRKWAEKGHPIIRLLEVLVGKEKIRQILKPPPQAANVQWQYAEADSVLAQFDRLGIGQIIAIDPLRPQVRAALGYLSGRLDLVSIGGDEKFMFFHINYPSIFHTPVQTGEER